jgi:hypothetical protein
VSSEKLTPFFMTETIAPRSKNTLINNTCAQKVVRCCLPLRGAAPHPVPAAAPALAWCMDTLGRTRQTSNALATGFKGPGPAAHKCQSVSGCGGFYRVVRVTFSGNANAKIFAYMRFCVS